MRRFLILLCLCMGQFAHAADIAFPPQAVSDAAVLSAAIPGLARDALASYQDDNPERYRTNRLRLQLLAGDNEAALATLMELRKSLSPSIYLPYEVFARARQRSGVSFDAAYAEAFRDVFQRLNDADAVNASWYQFVYDLPLARAQLERVLAPHAGKAALSIDEMLGLARAYLPLQVYSAILPLTTPLLAEDEARRFVIDDSVMIPTAYGVTLSAVVARPRAGGRAPGSLLYTIYPNTESARFEAKYAAARGYAGVVADARGKRLGTGKIEPYEHEVQDVNSVIDWMSRQAWSDGRVVMYGGSYSGFAQWAAAKRLHPALKAIAPYAAVIPGLGLPMENNVFLNANYGWSFYVGNTPLLDTSRYFDRQHWRDMQEQWFASGRPYRDIDKVEGTPNPALQRWLGHPSYDAYWQSMVAYKQDYANIGIPVLSVNGYFDDAQVSALHIFREHMKHRPNADHTMVIGPWDHFGLQASRKPDRVNEYLIDPVAQIDTPALTYAWFDHVLRGAPRPALLKDRINYQVMGANEWRHAPSIDKMADRVLKLYVSSARDGRYYRLSAQRGKAACTLAQSVDFKDRSQGTNDYYPYPAIGKELDPALGLSFVSEPFDKPVAVNGVFEGVLKATINKRDMDVGAVLYELMPDGRLFHLSYFIGRASYAQDMETRRLLAPGKVAEIPFARARMTSRQLGKGSRLLLVIDVNKNSGAQVNYGTGKDVSDESIADAGEPLKVSWSCDSFVRVPISAARMP